MFYLCLLQPEGRGPVSIRQSTVVDKEKVLLFDKDNKTMLRTCNGGPVVSEDKLRVLSPGGEVLDKKMRRKRSVGTMVNRSSDADREVKQAVQHRSNNDIRPRSSDNLSFRYALYGCFFLPFLLGKTYGDP